MFYENWKIVALVTLVQVLSECIFFAQGILASEKNFFGEEEESDWIRICVPLFYSATRHISEPCWRWICGGYGGRITTILGAVMIAVSVIAASWQELLVINVAYVILGGIGMGLVRLQVKLMKFYSEETDRSLWGVGVSGLGLSFWPLFTCLFVRSLGPKYAMLILGGITLHAVPLALLLRPQRKIVYEENITQTTEDEVVTSSSPTDLPDVNLSLEEYRLSYKLIEYESYRVRPSYYVEVLPGIPEESEGESDCERDHEMQRTEVREVSGENGVCFHVEDEERKYFKMRGNKSRERDLRDKVTVKNVAVKPFAYTIFVATVLLRFSDQLSVTIAISLLPNFAEFLMPNLRLQEKAFLVSLCGFSRVLAELPLLIICVRSKKSKYIFLLGPFCASIGLYLTWISTDLDTMTLASFGLGIGSGVASAALQLLSPQECPGVTDAADIIVGVGFLAIIPLTRILILGQSIRGSFLLCAWIYAAAAIVLAFNMRKKS